MCNITATRKMYLNGCKNRILDSSPSDVAYTRSHKKYFLQNCTNYPTGCLDDFYGHKRYSTTQFLELQKIDNSNDSFGALEIYGNNKEEINRIFLGNETNILLYVAAFATGFLVVITCLCLFIYLKSTLSKFNFYSSRCLQGIDEFNLREHSFEVINGYNLAELHSKNPHLTKIDDYICEVEIRSSKNKFCEDQEDLNHEVSGSDNEGAKNIIDELFNKIEHIQ
ncbi:hypothetical protein BEWA_010470 [Theileria equi strain WA]|uniref:Uncharacterized protein n=1 Tax=Theileria equi strain WA TaxID=1537102 RepID=L0B1C3_THEEQ|nr:hypothetical protein BEWA_010470 [Theileria equi strain WA]AFZ81630.1 hypothetical protein BEWA_010470 [Theileria equi strain WA]|eukprot:XP_004831296.1 hypothetical protein BEWA_010470 [Theileria equi strain WA]